MSDDDEAWYIVGFVGTMAEEFDLNIKNRDSTTEFPVARLCF
jgi:hypothetical protein